MIGSLTISDRSRVHANQFVGRIAKTPVRINTIEKNELERSVTRNMHAPFPVPERGLDGLDESEIVHV